MSDLGAPSILTNQERAALADVILCRDVMLRMTPEGLKALAQVVLAAQRKLNTEP